MRLGLAAGFLAGACQGAGAFVCTSDGDCVDGGMSGRCEPTGFCSFPDEVCPSMQRYGEHAGELSGECVALGEDTEAGSSAGTDGGTTLDPDDGTGGSDDAAATGQGGPTLEFVDDDEQDFAAGQLTGLVWTNGGIQLTGDAQGVLVSRVFDAGESVVWHTVRWIPQAPYGKPLPGGGQSEQGYAEGNIDMSANLLLLPLDGQGTAGPFELLEDASGLGHDLLLETEAGVPWVIGPFGTALADDMASYAHNGAWKDAFSFGEDDFTWSMWVRSDAPCDGEDVSNNQVYLGIEGQGSDRSHLWLGCRYPTSSQCTGDGGLGRIGGTYSANHGATGPRLCGSSELVDEQWHHVAVTKSGHVQAEAAVYFDGFAEDMESFAYADPIDFPSGTELALGAFSGGTFPAAGTFDEVAIWRRALAPAEIYSLYQRGVLRLRIQVRACDDPQCVGGEFVGPDGTSQTVYEDVAHALGPGKPLPLPESLVGRYFQYRAELEGASMSSPVLELVAVAADVL
ncbi:MAG: LamG domain-containing protein [Myxococcota bacterium]